MKHVIASVALFACVAALGELPAHAQGAEVRSTSSPRVETHSYGLQILGVDAAVIAGASLTKSSEVGVGGYLLGGPLVHLAHGHAGRALGSAALRAGLPLGGALIGSAIGESRCDSETDPELFCGLGEVAAGFIVGVATASIVDAAVLARDQVEVAPERTGLIQVGRVSATPNVIASTSTGGKHLSLGVTGTF